MLNLKDDAIHESLTVIQSVNSPNVIRWYENYIAWKILIHRMTKIEDTINAAKPDIPSIRQ